MSEHTPTPWLKPCEDEVGVISRADDQSYGMRVPILTCHSANSEADADFIVKAVNYHDRLREALCNMVKPHGVTAHHFDQARALLAELDNLEKQP